MSKPSNYFIALTTCKHSRIISKLTKLLLHFC